MTSEKDSIVISKKQDDDWLIDLVVEDFLENYNTEINITLKEK